MLAPMRPRPTIPSCTSRLLVARAERGADDAGEIAELRDTHFAPGVDRVEELVAVLHDAASDHDQLGPQHRVEMTEVRIETLGPLAPREVLLGALRVRRPRV